MLYSRRRSSSFGFGLPLGARVREENLTGNAPTAVVEQHEKVGVAGLSPVDDFDARRASSPGNIDCDNSRRELGRWPSLCHHPTKFFPGPIDRFPPIGTLNAGVGKKGLA